MSAGKPPRIGVFVCNCGINIGGIVRVPEVAAYAKTLPGVEYVEENLFTCSQDTQDKMTAVIRDNGLNRVVVAACTPRTHEELFQETLVNAGLNKYLVEMANIRNQDSWVHANDPDAATKKACDLVRMAVSKVFLAGPLQETDLPVTPSAMVVGGRPCRPHCGPVPVPARIPRASGGKKPRPLAAMPATSTGPIRGKMSPHFWES